MSVANVSISGQVTGEPSGSKQIGPFTIVNATSGGAVTELTSISGNNTITVPGSQYVACVIAKPSTNTASITLGGVAGDTGVSLHPTNPTVLDFPAGTSSFVLNVGSSGLAFELTWF